MQQIQNMHTHHNSEWITTNRSIHTREETESVCRNIMLLCKHLSPFIMDTEPHESSSAFMPNRRDRTWCWWVSFTFSELKKDVDDAAAIECHFSNYRFHVPSSAAHIWRPFHYAMRHVPIASVRCPNSFCGKFSGLPFVHPLGCW